MMDKIIIQISAGRGPVECSRVVAKIQALLLKQARSLNLRIAVLDAVSGTLNGTLLSATLVADAPLPDAFMREWSGTIQWIAESPYRRMHRRKNWFVGVSIFPVPTQYLWKQADVRFETCRSSGPGGQHVNKVETAVRGTHLPSGIQVLASDSRSQLQNRQYCLERLKAKVLAWSATQLAAQQQERWQEHHVLERGNAVKTIRAALT